MQIPPINENAVAGRVKRALIGKDILVTKDEVLFIQPFRLAMYSMRPLSVALVPFYFIFLLKNILGMQVASSCTIVSEKFRQEAPKLLQARYMNTLLVYHSSPVLKFYTLAWFKEANHLVNVSYSS